MKFDLKYEDIIIFIDKKQNKVKEVFLFKKAIEVPKYHKTFRSFKQEFNNKNSFRFSFIDRFNNGYEIYVDVGYAFKHFEKNTYFENRQKLNATLFPTLTKPFLVLKDIEQNTKKQRLTFYKPFYNKNKKLIHIVCFNLEESNKGNFIYKTLYQLSNLGKIKKYFEHPLSNILYLDKL